MPARDNSPYCDCSSILSAGLNPCYGLIVVIKMEMFDGHIVAQTHPMIYSESILKLCKFIRVEELNENKDILVKLFDTEVLDNRHPTTYLCDKDKMLTSEYIELINKYYENDFKVLGYEMIDHCPQLSF